MKPLLALRRPLQDQSAKKDRHGTEWLRLRSVILFLLVTTLLLGTASVLRAATVTAMWDANPEADMAGYKLSFGTQSGVYSTMVDVGNVTSGPLTLTAGQRYYFAVQAYNTSAMTSAYSAEVFFDVPVSTPPGITSLAPTSGPVGTSVTISGTNFGATKGTGTVVFNGTVATPTTWGATSLVVPVPVGATTGNVVVTVGGVASNGLAFTVTAPTITSRSPTSGVVGRSVTIRGANFGATKGTSTVTFNGTLATPTTWAATSIVVPVPAGATTGNVVVTVGGVASNGVTFTVVVPAPTITSRAPTSGPVGTSVTITGTNFGATKGTSTLAFNGTLAIPTTWAATSIVVPVPVGAATGNVVVTVGGVASNGLAFTVTAPTITSRSPTSGVVGRSVTIRGTNFGATKGTSTVAFNGTIGTPTSWSATSIVVPVPAGATTGNIVVTVGGVASNAVVFTVTTGALPAPWTSQDIGNPALAGSASWASGTFTVTGGGVDIWNTTDQFQFVYQPLDGDGEIVARVASLQNTHAWAKAGVMIREDLTTGAPNAMAQLTAGSGPTFQRRVTRDGSSTSDFGFAGVAPQWVRLVRSGNTFSGYYSATGSAWISMGSIVVPMASLAYVGLAVTSHAPSVVTTGTLTNVTITTTTPLSMTSQALTSGAAGTSGILAGTNLGTLTGTSPASHPLLAPRADYDGDGKADVTVYTPSTGTWSILESGTGTAVTATLGAAGDRPVPGDYDGDGKTDIAVYRAATGEWSALLSSTGALTVVTLGSVTDLPVPADYDRDGTTDVAIYRPARGEWIILQSSTGTTRTEVWGSSADVPVPGDYDGDAKADLAVYRPSTGLWQMLQSGTNTTMTATRGRSGDLPMPGDYDGDGKTDVAVYRASTGSWSILQSSTNTMRTVTWGSASDVPMPGDYDGDGTTDLAVFRPSTGLWQILQSSTKTTMALTLGMNTDISVR